MINFFKYTKKCSVKIFGVFLLHSAFLYSIDPNALELILNYLPENPIVIEAGAQFGEDTVWMSNLWPKGQIYAFEPVPETFEILKKQHEHTSNVQIFQLALSNKIEETEMYLAGGASSLLRPSEGFNRDYFHADLANPIKVLSTTLDEWAFKTNVNKIDFLWLDMEGNELRMLQACPEMLQTVKLIYTEVSFQRFWEGCVQYEDLKKWLEAQGFSQIWIETSPSWNGNALFLRTI